jgi:Transposase DNA-binding
MDSWIEEETRSVNLGDPRLRRRLQRVLARFSAQPEGSVPLACPGSAEMHGAYRFFQNKAVAPALLLGGHQAATLTRMAACSRVLCVGDTTFLNYPKQRAISGLGPHSNSIEHGLLLHPLVAFSPAGVCLGALHWHSWVRDPDFGKRQGHAALPIEQKESRRWGEQLRSLNQWRAGLPDTQLLYVADRESDIYELLAQPREPGVDLLIRSVGLRKTEEGLGLRAQAQTWSLPEGGRADLTVAARPGRAARIARVELRFGEVRLRAPWRRDRELPEVALRMVWVHEPAPPEGGGAAFGVATVDQSARGWGRRRVGGRRLLSATLGHRAVFLCAQAGVSSGVVAAANSRAVGGGHRGLSDRDVSDFEFAGSGQDAARCAGQRRFQSGGVCGAGANGGSAFARVFALGRASASASAGHPTVFT